MFGSELGSHNNFNHNIGNWDTGNVTNMEYMFYLAYNFNQDISNWNVSNVTDMSHMFHYASSFNQDLGAWHVDNVTDMTNMFSDTALNMTNYDNILIGWNSRPTLQNNVQLDSVAKYCDSATQRQNIIDTYSWTINDGGVGCVIDTPTVSTEEATGIDSTTATGNGAVTDVGGEDPERLIEWGTSSGTYTNECSAGIGDTGNYSCVMSGLTPNTTYYFRAKATNSGGSSYGNEMTFDTKANSASVNNQVKIQGNIKMKGNIKVK